MAFPRRESFVKPMKLTLELGEQEKTVLEFHFNQLLGLSQIFINNKPVKTQRRWFSEPLQETHEVEVGEKERAHVRIEKERKLLFGQRYRVYVNQRLTRVCEGV